ncbi:MAG TPA: FAD-binding and (Fe-S)-binding domain-containing protein [Anaerolineales bacterium]|nr:FAD-binding and (Fe-S)-binding domain-containing protein [Anaerolineales bacterium]
MTVRIDQDRVQNSPSGRQGMSLDAPSLASELRRTLEGEVRFDSGSRALYATDASNYRQVPIGVVVPKSVDDVIATIELCRNYGTPVLPRGGGTSLAGQCCNTAVVLDFTKYLNQILEIDPRRRLARVQPGVVLDELRTAAEVKGLTFGPDPATHTHCTLGGMIGNNSCGVHSVMAGRTADNVEELEILTYDGVRMRVGKTSEEELERIISDGGRRGEIYQSLKALRDRYANLIRQRFPELPRLVSGYALNQLLPENGFHVARALVGSEGTCVTVLEASLRLVDSRPERALLVLGYPDVYTAGDHVPEIMEYGPIGLEGIDDRLVDYMKRTKLHAEDVELLPKGGGWLLVEFGGDDGDAVHAHAQRVMEELKRKDHPPSMKIFDDPAQEKRIWTIRESALGATANVPGEPLTWEGWEDAAVPPERLGDYLRDFRKLLEDYEYGCSLYGHFGQGCVHTRIDFDLQTDEGIRKFRSFLEEAADLVVSYDGSFSGEHGDGQARASLLPKMFGEELVQAFAEFKAIWDPQGKMNPGKIVDPYLPDQNLRLGTDYRPGDPKTIFRFPEDEGSFAQTSLRCVGVGKCRRTDGGTMCPSYMVTLEEKHSTRGRARLLFEMLNGGVIGKQGWKDEAVKEALDLCLACKGCKGECPVDVDMATYKAEFAAHYYEGRLRPRAAYTFGLIHWWARLAAIAPGLANVFTQMPVIRDLVKWMAHIAPERQFPAFAVETFKGWYRKRPLRNEGKPRVILWADTFNNHFYPEVLKAGVEVLEAAGYQVIVPQGALCCGRPLYEWGMLDLAKKQLRQILTALKPQIQAGIPVVGLEPSCTAAFRDELTNLIHEEDAQKLKKQTYTLGEFLDKQVEEYELPKLRSKAVVHGHCHHKAIMRMSSEEALFEKMGLDYELLDSGCCGMAGPFGFEKGEHYEVSVKAGERVLLPAVRNASPETLIVTDGFSCREQIAQMTRRRALHTAQVIQMGLHAKVEGTPQAYPEREYVTHPADYKLPAAVLFGSGLLLAGTLLRKLGKKR